MRASRWGFVVRFLLLGLSALFVVWSALYALSRCDAEKELGPKYKPKARAARATEWREGIDWRDEIIYFVLIDRFCDGDSSNNKGRIPDSYRPWDGTPEHVDWLKAYQGGDLRGVINRLDYLSDLGITALWLSPVFDNSDSSFLGWWPYHGYQPRDFFAVDEHFGGTGDLCELVQQAHRRGIKVILDMVCNQVAPDHPWVSDSTNWHVLGYRHWFHRRSGVDASTGIENWHDQHQLETRELHGMPDLAQENPHVYAFLLDVAKYWINLTNCDGFRLDAVKHAPREFWRRYCADLHRFAGPDFLLLGEVFDGNIDYLARYAEVGFNAYSASARTSAAVLRSSAMRCTVSPAARASNAVRGPMQTTTVPSGSGANCSAICRATLPELTTSPRMRPSATSTATELGAATPMVR